MVRFQYIFIGQVDFFLYRTVFLYILLPQINFQNSGDFSVLIRTVLLFNYDLGGGGKTGWDYYLSF